MVSEEMLGITVIAPLHISYVLACIDTSVDGS